MSNCPIPGLDWVLAESGDTLPADTPRLFRRHGSNKTTFRTKGSEDITVSGRGSGQFWTEKTLKLSLPSEPGTMAKNVVDINRDNYGKGFRTASAWLLTDGPGGQSRWADDHDLFVSFELDDSSPDDVMDARNLASRIATPHDGGEPVTTGPTTKARVSHTLLDVIAADLRR